MEQEQKEGGLELTTPDFLYEKKSLFRDHYRNTDFNITKLPRREIAFSHWGSKAVWDRRHGFSDPAQIRETILLSPISAVFASIGHFLDPNEKVGKRGMVGLDLVFDIDKRPESNRVEWLEDISYETYEVYEKLTRELGFSENDIELEFSGNKGFHYLVKGHEDMHIEDRKSILQYLKGDQMQRKTLPVIGKGGWGGDFIKTIRSIGHVCTPDSSFNTNALSMLGLSKAHAKKLGDLAVTDSFRNQLQQGRLDIDTKVEAAIANLAFNNRKETFESLDKTVTADKNRVLRVPGSLHAESGFSCVKLSLDALSDPELVFESIIRSGGEDEVSLTLAKDCVSDLDKVTGFAKGTHTVPRWQALHLSVQN